MSRASTRSTKREEITKIAEAITAEKIALSKIDVLIGHELAERETLSPRQAALGSILCRKYRRQIPSIADALK